MSQEQTVFSQILQFISYDDFYICVRRHDGNKSIRRFSCWEQFLAMAFAQLTYRESLRDIEVCLAAHQKHLYRSGFRSMVRRSTLADANENRDWRIYADFAHSLIKRARPLYVDTDLGLDLDGTVYALDATTIDLCLSLFPWAPSRYGHGGVKLHTMIDIQGSIPVFIDITHARVPMSSCSIKLFLSPAPISLWTAATSISNVCTASIKPWPTLSFGPKAIFNLRAASPIPSINRRGFAATRRLL